jgi:flagellar biosynthesis component FlhA
MIGYNEQTQTIVKAQPIRQISDGDLSYQLQLGWGVVPLFQPDLGGKMILYIRQLRKSLRTAYGVELPILHIKDNGDIEFDEYRVLHRGKLIARGTLPAGGVKSMPAEGWIDYFHGSKSTAQSAGEDKTISDASSEPICLRSPDILLLHLTAIFKDLQRQSQANFLRRDA